MNPKRLVTVLLLAFVGASVVALVRKECGASNPTVPPPDAATATTVGTPATPSSGQVAVYYFHGSMRCATCRKIEAYAKEAVLGAFGNELASGTLTWREVDVEEPANGHFVDDFELSTRSVVVAHYRDGKCHDWKRLDQVWQLVDNKAALMELVRSATSAMLEEAGK